MIRTRANCWTSTAASVTWARPFIEDPLRVLRGMQFACRFDLEVDPDTAAMCASIADQYPTIARERVAEEWMKWATKASTKSRAGIRVQVLALNPCH